MSGRVISAAICALTLSATHSLAEVQKYDRSVEAAAAKIAAEKLGELRPTIGYDQQPDFVKGRAAKKPEQKSELRKPSWVREAEENTLPPITNATQGIDETVTGSINLSERKAWKRTYWDRFDQYGNPID